MNPLWEGDEVTRADPGKFGSAADDALLGSLRDALQPPPLSDSLVRRVESRWSPPHGSPLPRRVSWIAPALVAAALGALFILPAGIEARRGAPHVVLSKSDADLLLVAFAGGRWYGPSDAAIDRMLATVDELSSRLTPASDDEAADEWDLPPTKDESTVPGSSRARNQPHAVL